MGKLPRPSLWPRRNPSRKSSAISPKDSRMPRHAPARARSLLRPWLRTLRLMRRSLLLGWTSIRPSTASWKPPTTKCPDTNKLDTPRHSGDLLLLLLLLQFFFYLFIHVLFLFKLPVDDHR